MADQLDLFSVAPRNVGQPKIDWSKGGLQSLQLERFKGFESFKVDFDRTALLVGSNNSGKTSLLQAIRLFFWCVAQCGRPEGDVILFKKSVMAFSDFKLIPVHDLRALLYRGVSPNKKARGIFLSGTLTSGLTFSFRIYAAYSKLLVVNPDFVPDQKLAIADFERISQSPLYIPGFFGAVANELLAHDARLEELLNSGHHNEVLRNIVLRLRGDDEGIAKLRVRMQREFNVTDLDVPFLQKESEFLTAAYRESGNRIPLDFVSAGSGFLQVLQILAHALQNPSPILLLDEPDAHMHAALQRSFLIFLQEFAEEDNLQIIMASHSENFIREMDLSAIRVIDRNRSASSKFSDPALLEDSLSSAGIWPDHLELSEVLRTRRALLMEGGEDIESLDRLGRKLYDDWDIRRRMTQVVHTDGSSDSTVSRLEFVGEILDQLVEGGVRLAHLRDRDLMVDDARDQLLEAASKKKMRLYISEFRNREAYLIQPSVVERVVFSHYRDVIPNSLREPGAIEGMVASIAIEWCKDQIDSLPVKVQEFNRSWVRRADDAEGQRERERQIANFLRKEWTEPIAREDIPWKLVDGKVLLRLIRQNLQPHRISIPETWLHEAMEPSDYGDALRSLAERITEWTND